jgi:hypothetical protein
MDWLPKEDGILHFVEQILLRVKRVLPDIRMTIVGRNPFPRLVELNRQDPAITVIGRVDDVRPYMEHAGAYIVPVRIGVGAQAAATVRERFGWGNVAMRFSLICQNALQEFQQQKGKAVRAERRDAIA